MHLNKLLRLCSSLGRSFNILTLTKKFWPHVDRIDLDSFFRSLAAAFSDRNLKSLVLGTLLQLQDLEDRRQTRWTNQSISLKT